jgi:hypothetical protein
MQDWLTFISDENIKCVLRHLRCCFLPRLHTLWFMSYWMNSTDLIARRTRGMHLR